MLKNLVTDLKFTGGNTAKNLRYGKDRLDQGNSGQPYIVKDIPSDTAQPIGTGGPDFLLRGGYLVPGRSIDDVSRLTKMFFDKRSFNGPGFIAKQQVLSATGVRTQASRVLNEGGYLPTSTIGQAAVNAAGVHLLKQGIFPAANTNNPSGNFFGLIGQNDPLRINAYLYEKNLIEGGDDRSFNNTNRLVQLAGAKVYSTVNATKSPQNSPGGFLNFIVSNNSTTNIGSGTNITLNRKNGISLSQNEILKYNGGPGSVLGIGKTTIKRVVNTNEGIDFVANPSLLSQRFLALSPAQINKLINDNVGTRPGGETGKPDFRTLYTDEQRRKAFLPIAKIDYQNKLEERYNFQRSPGGRRPRTNYGFIAPLDTINALPIYQSSQAINKEVLKDIIDFRIGILDNKNPSKKNYMHFRAYIDSMSDNYASAWSDIQYTGRGEKFYKYNGFERTIDLSFTVAAHSRGELIPMYQKLNYLASSLAPDYSDAGYMRGNLVSLTVGGWCFEQIGVLMGVNYTIPQDSPWEIGIDQEGNTDKNVKQLPHRIQVSGFQFKPIHNFVPQINKISFADGGQGDNNSLTSLDNGRFLSSFGPERYIALADSQRINSSDDEGTSVAQNVNDNYGDADGATINQARNYIPPKEVPDAGDFNNNLQEGELESRQSNTGDVDFDNAFNLNAANLLNEVIVTRANTEN